MWITPRIGKNNETENSPFRATFSKKIQKFIKHWQIQLFCEKISTQNAI